MHSGPERLNYGVVIAVADSSKAWSEAVFVEVAGERSGGELSAVIHVITTFDVSQRSAYRLVGLSRSTFRRPLKADTLDDPDRALRAWLRDYARRHDRWGYRRAYVGARNDGWQVNHKKIRRLWAAEGLRVVVKRRRQRIGVSTVPAVVAEKPGDVWSVDFQFDSTITGKPAQDFLHRR